MKKIYPGFSTLKQVALGVGLFVTGGLSAQALQTNTYNFTGAVQSFTVPSCVTSITITCYGAEGVSVGNFGYAPGRGGMAQGVLPSFGGQVLNIYVGGQNGYNGGGSGQAGGNGGGASDVRLNSTALANRIVVAGGGGGAGGDNWGCNSMPGHGGGGTPVGTNFVGGGGGGGYTQCGTDGATVGGTGGVGYHGGGGGGGGLNSGGGGADANGGGGLAGSGTLGLGGASAVSLNGCSTEGAGGGGGGYYGGGGAAGTNCGAGRGGGGSSWTGGLSNPAFTAGARQGNGAVVIAYMTAPPNVNTNNVIANASNNAGICPGNSVTLSASNVASYTWQPGGSNAQNITVSPAVTTNYTVFGANTSGCLSMTVLPVSVISPPSLTVTNTNTFLCVGQAATLTVSGANTYSWMAASGSLGSGTMVTVSPVANANYTVMGQSGVGCITTVNMPIVVDNLVMSVSPGSVVCQGKTVVFTASGALSYQWNGSPFNPYTIQSASASAIYTVTGPNANGCTISNTVSLVVNPNPTVNATASKTLICKGDAVNLNGSGASTYSWSTGGSGSPITITPPFDVVYTYTVTGTDANGCTGKGVVSVDVRLCTGIDEVSGSTAFISVYPNPGNGNFSIQSEVTAKLHVVNSLGQEIKALDVTPGVQTLDLSGMADGIYFIKGGANGKSINEKIVITK